MITSFNCNFNHNAFLIDYFIFKKVSGIIGFSCQSSGESLSSKVQLQNTKLTSLSCRKYSAAKTIQFDEHSKRVQHYGQNKNRHKN